MRHHFTVDVEEYFQVTALEAAAPPISWGRFESRVDASVGRLLDLLAAHAARATFFVLGCGGGPPPRARQNDRRGQARDRVARMGPRDPTHVRFYSPLSLARLLGKTGYVARRWAGLYVMPYDIASRFLLLRRTVTLEGLLHVDLTVGRFFPFNRLGWNVIVAAQRRGAVA